MVFEIENEIFEHFPGMRIVALEVRGLDQDRADTAAIDRYLCGAWKTAAEEGSKYENPQSHPYIAPWGEYMKNVGAPRKKFPPSIEAMVRRACKSDEPFRIGPVVDFYNAVSLANIVPAGGYDLDDVNGAVVLRMSKQGDTFSALDSDAPEQIDAGEVSYADADEIITRHFIYKQSKRGLLNRGTKNVLFVSEILPELPEDTAQTVAKAFEDGLKSFFGADAKAVILDKDNRTI